MNFLGRNQKDIAQIYVYIYANMQMYKVFLQNNTFANIIFPIAWSILWQ